MNKYTAIGFVWTSVAIAHVAEMYYTEKMLKLIMETKKNDSVEFVQTQTKFWIAAVSTLLLLM